MPSRGTLPRMAEGDGELIRHALKTAREFGFRQVRLKSGELSFSATLDPDAEVCDTGAQTLDFEALPEGPKTASLTANAVGYFSIDAAALAKGARIAAGDKIGSILALGIQNDLTASTGGEVVAVHVTDGQAVEYGQVLAEVQL